MPINVSVIEANFEAGDTVSPRSLVNAGVISTFRKRVPIVKILGTGELTKKVTIEGCAVSESAKAKVEKAGGKVIN